MASSFPMPTPAPLFKPPLLALPRGVTRGHALVSTPLSLATGDAALDRRLGGGFPGGALSETCGGISSGRTTLLYGLLASSTRRGETVGLVDPQDRFDPRSAATAGLVLERILWVRPRGPLPALRAAEILLETRGFGLVALDLADGVDPALAARLRSAWSRLARRAAAAATPLLLLSRERLSGPTAHLCLSLSAARVRWPGHRLRPSLLDGIDSRIDVVRERRGAEARAPGFAPEPLLTARG